MGLNFSIWTDVTVMANPERTAPRMGYGCQVGRSPLGGTQFRIRLLDG
jgi:hypothetical protein